MQQHAQNAACTLLRRCTAVVSTGTQGLGGRMASSASIASGAAASSASWVGGPCCQIACKDCRCKWCKRKQNETPNPIGSRQSRFQHLAWKRVVGLECKSCPNVIKRKYWRMTKENLEKDLEKPDSSSIFMQRLKEWEQSINNGDPCTGTRRSPGIPKTISKKHDNVDIAAIDAFLTEEQLGYLWPRLFSRS